MSIQCPVCSKCFKSSRGLSIHTKKEHNLEASDIFLLINPAASRLCNCGEPLKFISMKKGFKNLCGKCSRKKAYKENNHIPWNKGNTKENSVSIKKASDSMKKFYKESGHHASGKTKENTDYIKENSKKISQSLKTFYKENSHWSAGKTSETSEVIAKRSKKSSLTQKGKTLSKEHKIALSNAKILKSEDVEERLRKYNFRLLSKYAGNQDSIIIECLECNHQTKKTLHSITYGSKCHKCFPPWEACASKWQLEINDFIKTLGFDTLVDDRLALSGKEIDILVPEKNFGIECDGLYWHSEASGRCKPNKSELKRQLAKQKNIELWFLFQDEWEFKQNIVKSMIAHKLASKNIKKIHGRKCKVEYCMPIELKDFINKTHIDGYVPASFGIKIIHEDEIVGACTLRWKRNSKRKVLEIARMSFALNTHVNGGVSKIISGAKKIAKENNANSLFTYSDNRIGGYCYKSFMKFKGETAKRFWWTNFSERFDRFKFKADKARGLTEKDVAKKANVSKIYGCTNSIFEITYQNF
jgi:hypothetical protein